MTNKNKIIFAIIVSTIVFGGIITQAIPKNNKYLQSIVASLNKNDFIEASGQYGGYQTFVTVAVETRTTNKLPNITGTCSVGDIMTFTIKKGATGTVSETITKFCNASPYALKPTKALPDGKYRVDVTIAAAQLQA